MMIGRCKTCQHWDASPELGHPPGWGLCHKEFERDSLVKAVAGACINTYADFGCVMHPENGGERRQDVPTEQLTPVIQ